VTSKEWLFVVFLVIGGQALVMRGAAPTTPTGPIDDKAMLIHVAGDHLTVELQGVPLETALAEIGRRTAIEIAIAGSLSRTISIEFHDLPVEEGLRRLLRGYNWVMLYADSETRAGSTLKKVTVLSAGDREHPTPVAAAPTPTRENTLIQAVTALVAREEVRARLGVYLHGSDARAMRDAFQGLIEAVAVEEFELLIDMLQDQTIQLAAWEAALAPLSELMTVEEQKVLLASLRDQTVRGSMVRTLESYRRHKTREEAKAR
jgi:hypothetical protein